jgi:pimeloyl-ACP methyl ester carboxylesterase
MVDGKSQLQRVGCGLDERQIAFQVLPPSSPDAPIVLWLIGLKSDMVSTKAEALAKWCPTKGFGLTRFDYSGHGQSSGDFEKATVSDWLEEASEIFRHQTGNNPVIVVGSSTGAHVALLMLRQLRQQFPQDAERIRGLVLIAPAWDVTDLIWSRLPEKARHEVMTKGIHYQPSEYDEPYPISKVFIEDGREHTFSGTTFDPGCPVLVLQGVKDESVPVDHARALSGILTGDWLKISEVADGEHRLSRPQDLEKIFSLIEQVATGREG